MSRKSTVGEQELLGIVEGLEAFEGILRGQDVNVHTDRLNLLYSKYPSQRMIRWRLMLEEFHPTVVRVAGKENDAADALSRLEMDDNEYNTHQWEHSNLPLTYQDELEERIQMLSPLASEKELQPSTKFPLATDLIKFYQLKDKPLQQKVKSDQSFMSKTVEEEAVSYTHLTLPTNREV